MGAEPVAEPDRLGEVLRERRVRAGLGVRQLAKMTELSPSFVSQVERGLTRPRIANLHRLARALNTTAQSLLAESSSVPSIVSRRADAPRVPHNDGGSPTIRTLVAGARRLAALEMVLDGDAPDDWYDHPGDELYIVVRGCVEVEVGSEQYRLGPGDSVCYDGEVPHRSRRVGEEAALVYLITSRHDT